LIPVMSRRAYVRAWAGAWFNVPRFRGILQKPRDISYNIIVG
jgi:hypothetical protein